MKNQCLTYSAICAALGTIFLSVGFFLQAAVSLWVFLASICVMMSLETGRLRYAVLTHIVITLLSLIFNGFNFIYMIPYIFFMGICPIFSFMFERTKMPALVAYFIKQALFILSMMIAASFSVVFFNFKPDSFMSVMIIIVLCIPSFFFYNLGMVNIRKKLRLFMGRKRINFESEK